MTKSAKSTSKSPSVASDILQGLNNALAYSRGENTNVRVHVINVPAPGDIKKIRRKLGMSQNDFATQFGVSPATLRNWEQGRRLPDGPARALLTIIDREPEAVRRALQAG